MYEQFASVYDEFMQDVPYEDWADYIESLWSGAQGNTRPSLVLDLGCGTGTLSLILARRGYEMIGADQSEEMLSVAAQKAAEEGQQILFLNQPMQELELYGTVDAVICTCDALNYLLETDDLLETFCRVNNYLNPGGLFIFDVNTAYKFEHVLGEQTRSEVYDDAAYIWENHYDPEEKINEYAVTFFHREGRHYVRDDEYHYERAYDMEEITDCLKAAGLKLKAAYEAFSTDAPGEKTQRICFVAQEYQKESEK